MKGSNQKGFTLLEMLATIAIIAILIGIAIPIVGKAVEKAREATCLANMRSFMEAYEEQRILSSSGDDAELIQLAARQLNVTANQYTITGLCPSDGIVTVETYSDGSIKISCSKHGGSSGAFAQTITSLIIEEMGTLTRKIDGGKTQTLKAFLDRGGSQIDSEALDSGSGTQETWTKKLKAEMASKGSALLNQGWSIKYDTKSKQYVVAVTTGGKSTLQNATNGQKVDVVEYVYDSSGKLVSQEQGTMKAETRSEGYNRLTISTFEKSK